MEILRNDFNNETAWCKRILFATFRSNNGLLAKQVCAWHFGGEWGGYFSQPPVEVIFDSAAECLEPNHLSKEFTGD